MAFSRKTDSKVNPIMSRDEISASPSLHTRSIRSIGEEVILHFEDATGLLKHAIFPFSNLLQGTPSSSITSWLVSAVLGYYSEYDSFILL